MSLARTVGATRTYADWRELLEREKPQVVSIAMRHADQHAEVALACLRAGAHLYMEKPFVRSPDEADAVLKDAHRMSCPRRCTRFRGQITKGSGCPGIWRWSRRP